MRFRKSRKFAKLGLNRRYHRGKKVGRRVSRGGRRF